MSSLRISATNRSRLGSRPRLNPAQPKHSHFIYALSSLLFILSACSASMPKKTTFRDFCCSTPEATKLYNEANAKNKAGDRQGAIALYQEALRLEPEYLCAKVNLGLIFSREKRYREALPLLQEASMKEPGDALLHSNLGNIHRSLGELSLAEAEYKKAVELDATQEKVLYDLAGVQKDQKKYEEAARNYEAFIRLANKEAGEEKRLAYAHTYLAWHVKQAAKKGHEKRIQDPFSTVSSTSPGTLDTYYQLVPGPKDNRNCGDGHAVVILLDKSMSVQGNSLLDHEKQMVIAALPTVSSAVSLGIIAFDFAPFIITPLAKFDKHQGDLVRSRLTRLVESGKTDVLAGLRESRRQLERYQASCKSVVLLSDAKFPTPPSELTSELAQYRDKNIHLSTIVLGRDGDVQAMKFLAKAGQGSFTQVAGRRINDRVLADTLHYLGVSSGLPSKGNQSKRKK